MIRYIRLDKPVRSDYDFEPSCYEGFAKTYEEYKTKKDTIILNEGKDDEFIFVNEEDTDAFYITSVSREDFEARGWDVKDLTDSQMRRIADKMSESYLESGQFWLDIDYWAEEYGCKSLKK